MTDFSADEIIHTFIKGCFCQTEDASQERASVFAHDYTPDRHFAHHNNPLRLSPAQTTDMGSAARLSLLGLLLCTQLGRAPARSLRTADQVSEADIQRLLHGVMEQLGIARPRVEYPAHQATNIVGPQSIQGKLET